MIKGKSGEQEDNKKYSRHFLRIPNVLFASYKNLLDEEKFLYCKLKYLYWDAKKPQYISLREISDLTGYPKTTLSRMIPHLHMCKLIHAEIRRGQRGNAKYYISILDIWDLNDCFYSLLPDQRTQLDPSAEIPQRQKRKREQVESDTTPPAAPPTPTFTTEIPLSEEEKALWIRWCEISHEDIESINTNSHRHIRFLVGKSVKPDNLQSLYDHSYERIKAIAKDAGREPEPPVLFNLVKAQPSWKKSEELKGKDQQETQEGRLNKHLQGTGRIVNTTYDRLNNKDNFVVRGRI